MPTKQNALTSKIEGRVAHITIDHPPMNTVSIEIMRSLARMVAGFEQDPAIRAILLDSANNTPPFAAHADDLTANLSWEAQSKMVRDGQRALTSIEFASKPVVMAIYDGMCMGGGLELALACHIRVAGSKTVFAVPEAQAGAMPGWGNTQRLVRLVGRAKGLELALTGSPIPAHELLTLGAINRLVPGERVLAEARRIADAISRMRSKSISAILAAFNTHYQIGLAEGKATELERYMEIYDPQTFVAAVKALFEQRRIDFAD
jgi:enoyl-CoA hydratase/carnithine racemase